MLTLTVWAWRRRIAVGGKGILTDSLNECMNELMTRLFIEQPLALPGSANKGNTKNIIGILFWLSLRTLYVSIGWPYKKRGYALYCGQTKIPPMRFDTKGFKQTNIPSRVEEAVFYFRNFQSIE